MDMTSSDDNTGEHDVELSAAQAYHKYLLDIGPLLAKMEEGLWSFATMLGERLEHAHPGDADNWPKILAGIPVEERRAYASVFAAHATMLFASISLTKALQIAGLRNPEDSITENGMDMLTLSMEDMTELFTTITAMNLFPVEPADKPTTELN